MPATPTEMDYRTSQAERWQSEYAQHLRERLRTSVAYVGTVSRSTVRAHMRSFLTLLEEARRYPELEDAVLSLTLALRPWPLRWGLGSAWEDNLRYILRMNLSSRQRMALHNELAKQYLAVGDFAKAETEAQAILNDPQADSLALARACRRLFVCYRSTNRPELVDQLMAGWGRRLGAGLPARQVPPELARAWLHVNQCQIDLLREQGRLQEALTLVNEMLWLDTHNGSPEGILTAQLYDRRAVLLWESGRSRDAVSDLQHAISIFLSEEDLFSAESLYSDLGLVYWSMGDLQRAEECMLRVIQYFRRVGAVQLLVPNIGNMGLVEFMRGNLQRAQDWFEEQITLANQLEYWSEVYRGIDNLSDLQYYRGDYGILINNHNTTDSYYQKHGLREGYWVGRLWVACASFQLGEQEEALAEIRRTLEWSLEHRSPVLEMLCRRCLAWFSPPEEREPLLLRSLELARAQEKRFEEAAALLALAQVAQPEARRQEYWREGAAILQQMGAARWLEGCAPQRPPFLPMFV